MKLKIIFPMLLMSGTASCTNAMEAQDPPAATTEDAMPRPSGESEGSDEPADDLELQSPVGLD